MKTFWFHFNKPQSLKEGKPQITIHYMNTCYIVDNLEINVPTYGYLRKEQPRFVVKGKCNNIEFKNKIAKIQ